MTPFIRRFGNPLLMAATIVAAIALGSQAPRLVREWRGHARSGDFRAHVAGQPARLTLYGTSTCPHCASALT
ncbi:hypothetical protein LP419_25495 [Massilia sp. H-1]|nr:hypothetical protein LP419_25495 [Massilia sp. H-1]